MKAMFQKKGCITNPYSPRAKQACQHIRFMPLFCSGQTSLMSSTSSQQKLNCQTSGLFKKHPEFDDYFGPAWFSLSLIHIISHHVSFEHCSWGTMVISLCQAVTEQRFGSQRRPDQSWRSNLGCRLQLLVVDPALAITTRKERKTSLEVCILQQNKISSWHPKCMDIKTSKTCSKELQRKDQWFHLFTDGVVSVERFSSWAMIDPAYDRG